MFMADYARQCIYVMLPGANGLPDPTKVEDLATGLRGPTDLHIGPGGDLYMNDLIGGTISRLSYSGANRPPTAQITADHTNGPAPLTVKFDATASVDPDGDPHALRVGPRRRRAVRRLHERDAAMDVFDRRRGHREAPRHRRQGSGRHCHPDDHGRQHRTLGADHRADAHDPVLGR